MLRGQVMHSCVYPSSHSHLSLCLLGWLAQNIPPVKWGDSMPCSDVLTFSSTFLPGPPRAPCCRVPLLVCLGPYREPCSAGDRPWVKACFLPFEPSLQPLWPRAVSCGYKGQFVYFWGEKIPGRRAETHPPVTHPAPGPHLSRLSLPAENGLLLRLHRCPALHLPVLHQVSYIRTGRYLNWPKGWGQVPSAEQGHLAPKPLGTNSLFAPGSLCGEKGCFQKCCRPLLP